jgi:LCP family protein required for cell wall assembly
MVAALDVVQGTCHVMSVPRDTMVIRAPRSSKKINAAFRQRRNTWDDEPGMPQLKKEIATLIGYRPQYSVVVDYKAVESLIDALGYVEFDVPVRMNVPLEGINLQRGPQRLNGEQAMQLLRFRGYGRNALKHYLDTEDPINDDFGRMKIQQLFLTEAGKKAFSNWTKFPEYISIAQENVTSDDIDWGHILWFAEQIHKIGMENVVFSTLPTRTLDASRYYEVVRAEESLALINETINPFYIPIGMELLEY